MCGVVYTPDTVTNEPKIHGVVAAGLTTPTGGRVGCRRGTRGYTYTYESKVDTDLHNDTGVLGF